MSVQYEPFSPAIRDDPYPHYAALRNEAPVYFAEQAQAFCISRYEDARAVLLDPARFSSDAMRTMLTGAKPGVDPMTDPAVMQRMLALAQRLPFPMEALISARNLISEDPPRHGPLRSLVNRGFTPRQIAAWEPRLRAVAAECMAKLRERSTFDVIHDLAIPLPVQIITEMLGVASDRRADFKLWSDGIVAGTSGSGRGLDPVASGFAAALQALCGYVTEVAAERRHAPSDDLVSVLLTAQDDEVALSDAEVAFFVLLLLVAGNETTTNLIGNAMHALLCHPAEFARVRADRSLLPNLVEEALRFDSPAQIVFRRTTCEVEVAGTRIPKDQHVIVLIGSANRDERRWGPDAGAFALMRDTQGHLAFGVGNHFCLGAALARLEARVALEALLAERTALESCTSKIEYIDSFLVRGPRTLTLRRAA